MQADILPQWTTRRLKGQIRSKENTEKTCFPGEADAATVLRSALIKGEESGTATAFDFDKSIAAKKASHRA